MRCQIEQAYEMVNCKVTLLVNIKLLSCGRIVHGSRDDCKVVLLSLSALQGNCLGGKEVCACTGTYGIRGTIRTDAYSLITVRVAGDNPDELRKTGQDRTR